MSDPKIFTAFDSATKQRLDIPEEQANEAFSSGAVLPKKGDVFNVVGPDGVTYDVPAERLPDVLSSGGQIESSEQRVQRKFGDDEIKAGVAGAARGLSFGLSDVALTQTGAVDPETLAGLKQANPVASGVGEAAGIVGGLIGTGGVGAGVKIASKAGLALEARLAAQGVKALQRAGVSSKVAQALVTKGLARGAGSATEASLYGVGNAISEAALGRADFNAENVLASAKDFAIFGGLAGAGLGLAGAGLSATGRKIADSQIGQRVKDKLNKLSDPVEAVVDTLDMPAARQVKFEQRVGELKNDLPKYFKDEVGVKTFDTLENLAAKNEQALDKFGKQIDSVLTDTNTIQAGRGIGVTVGEFKKSIREGTDALFGENSNLKKIANSNEFNLFQREQQKLLKNADLLGGENSIVSISNLQELRKQFDKNINYLADVNAAAKSKFNYAVRSELRDLIDDSIAKLEQNVPELAGSLATLKAANKNYHLGSLIKNDLAKAVVKEEKRGLLQSKDVLLGTLGGIFAGGPAGAVLGLVPKIAQSQMLNNMRILGQIEKANQNVQKTIKSSVDNFFKPGIPLAQRAAYSLQESDIGRDDNNKKPASQQAAFDNANKNLARVKSDYNAVLENINRRTAFMYKAAPETASQVDAVAFNAAQFLASKLPMDVSPKGLVQELKRRNRVSSQALAKFQRYVNAVEKPLDVVKSLSQGRIDREGVETLKNVYPNIYGDLKTQIMDKITDNPDALSYQKRLQLGILLDIPSDTSLLPENVMGLQSNYAPEEEQAGPLVPPTQGGMSAIEKSGRLSLQGESELD
jgi:hypothetical protein